MPKLSNTVWNGLKRRLGSMAMTFTGRRVGIEEIPRASGEIGYTARGSSIFLSRDNEYLDKMKTEAESTAFVMGVFAHELMHQLITDFPEFEKTLYAQSKSTARIFKVIFNVMEDPAIEAQARYYIGGDLLSSLHYAVMTTYRHTKSLQKSHPMTQLINALIMYGDGGFVKGKIRSAKARRIFHAILPTVDKAIEELSGKKRVQYAYEVFLMTKPLWERDIKNEEALRKLLEELGEMMSQSGKNTSGSNDQSPVNPERNEGASDPAADKKKKRRKITYRKVSKEELEEMKKAGATGKDDGVSDIEVLYCDDPEAQENGGSGDPDATQPPAAGQSDSAGEKESGREKSASGKNDPEKGSEAPENGAGGKPGSDKETGDAKSSTGANGEKAENANAEKDGDTGSGDGSKTPDNRDTSGDKSDAKSLSGGSPSGNEETDASGSANNSSEDGDGGGVASDGGDVDYSREEVIDDIEYELTEEEVARVKEILDNIKDEEAMAKSRSDACHAEDLDVPALKANYAGVACLNKRVRSAVSRTLEAVYSAIIDKFSMNINRLTNQMKRIINNDRGDRLYRSSGKVCIPRLCNGRMTTSVFRRNIDPANKADMCVLYLVDESGSMGSGNKSKCAMECTVCMAEVFSRLHIPVKVIGFTADVGRYDVVHNHYMHWLNTYEERLNLTSITHRSNNFDGYSIRYATEMLMKRPEEHKLLIILSDGQPAANYYVRGTGISDTMDAIKCAKKKVDVIGVGVGSASTKVWEAMYGNSFLHVKNADDLLVQIGVQIQKIMKKW